MSGLFTRRGILYAATGSIVAVGAVGAGSLLACNARREVVEVATRLAPVVTDVAEPSRLAAWSAGLRTTSSVETLVMDGPLGEIATLNCVLERRARFAELTRSEFRAGRFVVADRLVVSDAECLLAAFVLQNRASST
jgi:hypothetical protein